MTQGALRIRHYLGGIVAACWLAGALFACILVVQFRGLEERSRALEQRSAGLAQVGELERALEDWTRATRESLGGEPAHPELDEEGRELQLRLGELREVPGLAPFRPELEQVASCLESILGSRKLPFELVPGTPAHAERLAEVRGGVDVLVRQQAEALARIARTLRSDLARLEPELERLRSWLGWTLGLCALGYLGLVLGLWRWAVARLVRPLQSLGAAAQGVLQGATSVPIRCAGPHELRLLGESLASLQRKLVESREQLEQKVRERTLALERANRAKDEFLANMSHEIRTPMTAILGYAELLLAPDTAETDRQRYAEIIFANGEHLLSVINDILDVSKIEAGRMTVAPTLCSPFEVALEVKALMDLRAREKGLELAVSNEGPIPELVRTDPTRLRQILLNLVNNAIKFTEQGSVRLDFRMEHAPDGAERLAFLVRDTGVGMTQEEIERVFRPFIQADSSTTRKYGGTGLGLAISQALARLLGGDLTCRSVPGSGSVFHVTIDPGPLEGVRRSERFPAAEKPAPRALGPAPGPVPLLNGRVLLAEDVAVNRRLVAMILERSGVEVECAENGRQALECALAANAAGRPFDILFMDIQMPEMDGYEATRCLREAGYPGPIVALTSHSLPEERERCLAAGCDEFMTKPVDRLALLQVLLRFLPATPAGGEQEAAS